MGALGVGGGIAIGVRRLGDLTLLVRHVRADKGFQSDRERRLVGKPRNFPFGLVQQFVDF